MVRLTSIKKRTGGCRNSSPVWVTSYSWVIVRKITSSESLPFAGLALLQQFSKLWSLDQQRVPASPGNLLEGQILRIHPDIALGGWDPGTRVWRSPPCTPEAHSNLAATDLQNGLAEIESTLYSPSLILIFYDCLSWQRATC